MLRVILISFVALLLLTVAVLGVRGQKFQSPPWEFWGDMNEQPRYDPQSPSPFFSDGKVERPKPVGTVPWGRDALRPPDQNLTADDRMLYALDEIPGFDKPENRRAILARGAEQYATHCAVCHGLTGAGNGITTQYGMNNPPTYHSDRLRLSSHGYIFQVITEGKNTMGPYGGMISRSDRWAIVAHVRALQTAFAATLESVPESRRAELEGP